MERGRFVGRGAPTPAAPVRGGRDTGREAAPATNRRPVANAARSTFQYKPRDPELARKMAEGGDDFDKFLDLPKEHVFKPKDGANTIRPLPPTFENAEHYGLSIYVHYQVGPDAQSYLCLHKMKGEACPVCEERALAIKAGDEQYAKDCEPKRRVLFYLLDRNNDPDVAKAYVCGTKLDGDIIKIMVDPSTGEVLNVDDPDNGYDVSFTKSGKGLQTRYEGAQIARRASAVTSDAALDFIQQHPLDTVLKFFSYEHIQAEFMGGAPAPRDGGHQHQEAPARGGRESSRSREPDITWDYVWGLTGTELDALVESNPDLKGVIDLQAAKDDDDLKAWICETLHLTEAPPPREEPPQRGGRGVAPEPAGGLQRMRITRR